jgi:Fe-S-cluster containining protein
VSDNKEQDGVQVEFEVELHRDRTKRNLNMAVKPVQDVKLDGVPDCQQCGLCCCSAFAYQHGVCVTEEDFKLLPEEYRQAVVVEALPPALEEIAGPKEFKSLPIDKIVGVKLFSCRFLLGKPAEKCSCAIYNVRPSVCRKYTRGSEECLDCVADLHKISDAGMAVQDVVTGDVR